MSILLDQWSFFKFTRNLPKFRHPGDENKTADYLDNESLNMAENVHMHWLRE
jgi:hypothetical protein